MTTDAFLDQFDLESLADLPDLDDLRTMSLADTVVLDGTPAGAPASPEPVGRASLPSARRPAQPSSPTVDLTGPLAEVAAAAGRVTARFNAVTPDDDEDVPPDEAGRRSRRTR